MNDITLEPDGHAVRRLIEQAIDEHCESPVQYAFENGWPVGMTRLEAFEVLEAVREYRPRISNIHGSEHKQRAVRHIHEQIGRGYDRPDTVSVEPMTKL